MSARTIIEAKAQKVMRVADVLAKYRPTDMVPPDVPVDAPLAEQWAAVWDSIERNHVAHDPVYWQNFSASVAKKQREPVRLGDAAGPAVINGHHRLWALVKAGKQYVSVATP